MNKTKSLALTAIVGCLISSPVFSAEAPSYKLTGNIGVSNNYLWRGVTQTDDESAVSGGIDYTNKSGLYVGTWFSNMANGSYEHDLYAGFAGKTDQLGYDVGLIMYMYPIVNNMDFTEIYGKIEIKNFDFGLALTVDSDAGGDDSDFYMHAGGKFQVKKDLTLDALIGNYLFDSPANEDYLHFKVGLSKNDIRFGFEKNDRSGRDQDDMRLTVSWSKEIVL